MEYLTTAWTGFVHSDVCEQIICVIKGVPVQFQQDRRTLKNVKVYAQNLDNSVMEKKLMHFLFILMPGATKGLDKYNAIL